MMLSSNATLAATSLVRPFNITSDEHPVRASNPATETIRVSLKRQDVSQSQVRVG